MMDHKHSSAAMVNKKMGASLDHLQAELKRVELMLCSVVKKAGQSGDYAESGKYPSTRFKATNSKSTVSALFENPIDIPDIDTIQRSLREVAADIARKETEAGLSGTPLRLRQLQRVFGLSSLEIDIILICLWPELDSRFERFYAFLHDDITRTIPSINMIMNFLGADFEDTLSVKQAFYPDNPLIKHHLIHIRDSPLQNTSTLAARSVQIDERIVDYLSGIDLIDARLKEFAEVYSPEFKMNELFASPEIKKRLVRFASGKTPLAPVYLFYGVPDSGKRTTAEALCHELKIPLLHVDMRRMLTADIAAEDAIEFVFREGLLQKAVIFLNGADLLWNSQNPEVNGPGMDALLLKLANYPDLVILSSEKRLEIKQRRGHKLLMDIEFTLPDFSIRKQLWKKQYADGVPLAEDINYDDLANKFRLSAGQITEAAGMARSLAQWRDPTSGVINGDDLYKICRQLSRQRLTTLTHPEKSRYEWDDIILPKDQKEQLMEICNQVKYRQIVYHDWGFGHKLVRGKGLNILFSGPSGTGKTMAAEIIGNTLGIDVYKIDLSTIVDKYIGETEKNLDRIFREATTTNAIIFFDEADSIFGKRSEVRDSHDRYANIEVSYLLQKIEVYDGITILATNLRKNLDEAFTRRMHFSLEFPIPDETYRFRIWQRMFPEKAPIGADIDLVFLARQFVISGGNIRNIVLTSAFLAAQDGGVITMEHLIRATRREYQKMGRLCTEPDFARYFNLVKG